MKNDIKSIPDEPISLLDTTVIWIAEYNLDPNPRYYPRGTETH